MGEGVGVACVLKRQNNHYTYRLYIYIFRLYITLVNETHGLEKPVIRLLIIITINISLSIIYHLFNIYQLYIIYSIIN